VADPEEQSGQLHIQPSVVPYWIMLLLFHMLLI